MKKIVRFIKTLNPFLYRPIVLIAWSCFISVFVFAILSEVNSKNFYMGGLYATLALIMVFLTFITTFLTGREK